jgi:putative aminopeptidase FrvX
MPMDPSSLAFLKALVEAPSPSGYEQPAQQVWRERVRPFADRVETDTHGNAIGVRNPAGRPRVLLAGHVDELGFIVKYVSDDGFLYFRTIGGFDLNIIPGRRVVVHAKAGPVPGVVGRKAIHLMTEDDRKKKVEMHELWIDIGAKDKKDALSLVSIGDPVTYPVGLECLRGDLYTARGFDDKAGSFVVAEVLRLLAGASIKAAVFSVSTVQEEVGLRGAHTSAFGIDPQIGVAVDVTHATDHPDMDKKRAGEVKLGAGPTITRGANCNPAVVRLLIEAAEAEHIPYQLEAEPGGTGTDANAIQLTRAGVATGLVSVPNRYMHTPVEMLALSDLENAAKLLAAFVRRLDDSVDLTP